MTADADRTPDELRGWLAQIADMAALLPDAAITRSAGNKTSRPTPASKPPANLNVVHLLDHDDKPPNGTRRGMAWSHGMQYVDPGRIGVLPYLDGWVRDLEATLLDQHPDVPADEIPAVPTVAGCCSWLARHADAAATTDQWPELVYGVRAMVRNMRNATSGVRDLEERPVPCPRCGDPLHRVGDLALWECETGHQTSVQAVTLRQASEHVGIPLSTLKGWSHRPGFLPCLRESERVSYYDLGTIQRLAAEARLRSG